MEDSIRFFVGKKPIGDDSGLLRWLGDHSACGCGLNRQDGGRRQSILITNNEVSAAEATELRDAGLLPGDSEWEDLGIFEHITKPRVTAAVTGTTADGEPIKATTSSPTSSRWPKDSRRTSSSSS